MNKQELSSEISRPQIEFRESLKRYLRTDDWAGIVDVCERVLPLLSPSTDQEQSRVHVEVLSHSSFALAKLGDFERAERNLRAAIALQEEADLDLYSRCSLHFELAVVLNAIGRIDKAAENLACVLNLASKQGNLTVGASFMASLSERVPNSESYSALLKSVWSLLSKGFACESNQKKRSPS